MSAEPEGPTRPVPSGAEAAEPHVVAAQPGGDDAEPTVEDGAASAQTGVLPAAGRAASAAWQGLSERHGLRAGLAGAILVIVGLLLGAQSAVAVSLLAVGVAMLVIGWAGSRLRGRFAIEFGPEGTSIELRAHVASPVRVGAAAIAAPATAASPRVYAIPRRDAVAHDAPAPGLAASPSAVAGAHAGEPPDADVIESTGETIEMDVSQLKALLAAERVATT
jgi:hypothetical protein